MTFKVRSRLSQFAPIAMLALLFSLLLAAQGKAAGVEARTSSLSEYTTARAVHGESIEEAQRQHPVHLRAVVTYFDPRLNRRHVAVFIHDATGAVFVAATSVNGPVAAGSIVDIRGVSDAGDFAPIVSRAAVTYIGMSAKPIPAPLVTLGQLLSGQYEGQWIAIKGVVHSATEVDGHINLEVATGDGLVHAIGVAEPGANYQKLVDAKVCLHANSGPTYNRYFQMTGVRLFLPNMNSVTVEEPAPADPFSVRLHPIDHLLRYSPHLSFRRWERIRGAVTLQWPGRMLCVEDEARPLCMQTRQEDPVAVGDIVDAVGFPALGEFNPTMTDVVYRETGAWMQVAAPLTRASEALKGDKDAALIQVEGKLIGREKGSDSTLMISSGKLLFPIVLPPTQAGQGRGASRMQELADGSVLRLTGICLVSGQFTERFGNGYPVPTSFRLLLRTPADVTVLERPTWWTAEHLLPVLAMILGVTLFILAWAAVLRHQLAEQTTVIRRQNVELTAFSFQDGLTGLANRRKFDETLALELARAARAQVPLSLLMIDIDYFKALNDACGHQQGDVCLVQVAAALHSASLRAGDLIARYGGEEFCVILPMSDERAAFAAAERMRQAVCNLALVHPASGCGQYISVSIGAATIVPDHATQPTAVIALADQALYQSKQTGRDRTTCAITETRALAAGSRSG